MSITHEDLEDIRGDLDDRYVLQSQCNERQEEVNRKFAHDDKRIDLVIHDFETLKRIGWIVATATIGQLVVAIFEKII